MELHQRARNHISTHRMAELYGHGSTEEYEKETDMKSEAFGPHPQQNPLSNEYVINTALILYNPTGSNVLNH